MNHDTFHGNDMTDADMTQYLLDSADVPAAAKMAYAAGYFESTLLSLMARFPEVRAEIEARVRHRMVERGEIYVCTSRAMAAGFNVGENV